MSEKVVPVEDRLPNDNDLHDTNDPSAWAERFVEKYEAGVFANGIDEGLMITWFACVMQAAYRQHPVEIKAREDALRAIGIEPSGAV